jgi:hypothetical protein
LHFLKIGARAEHLLLGADMQDGKTRAAREVIKLGFERAHPFFADRIHRRMVQRQDGHRIVGAR